MKALKFLGLVYVPETKDSEAVLVAATRSGKSTLQLDCYDILKYSQQSSLLFGIGEYSIKDRLARINSYRPTEATKVFRSYYQQLLMINKMIDDNTGTYEYLAALAVLVSKGVNIFIYFFITGAFKLHSINAFNLFLELKDEVIIWEANEEGAAKALKHLATRKKPNQLGSNPEKGNRPPLERLEALTMKLPVFDDLVDKGYFSFEEYEEVYKSVELGMETDDVVERNIESFISYIGKQ